LLTFVLTRVERSLFYPAVEPIGANEIYTLCHDSRHRNPSIPAVTTTSRLLPSERAALGQPRLATSGLAQDLRAALADDDCVGVREDGGDGEASGALDVHEEGAGSRHESLELVLAGLSGRGGVEKVNCENHIDGLWRVLNWLLIAGGLKSMDWARESRLGEARP
jgi:hypothetical protein